MPIIKTYASAVRNERKKPKAKSISLCTIMKDEERWLRQFLTQVCPLVDEVILVDTGSTDRSIEIAQSFGAKILYQKWEDDFAKARNYSLEHANCEWILSLDPDEVIAEQDHAAFRDLLKDTSVCWEFLMRNYTHNHQFSDFQPIKGEYPDWEKDQGGYFECNRVRLFPNHPRIRYRGKVHELVEHAIREIGEHDIQRTPIPIHHYGYTIDKSRVEKKAAVYTAAGEAKIQDDPSHWQSHFEIAVEYTNNGAYDKSIAPFQKAAELNPGYVPIWTNLGFVYCQLARYQEAIRVLNHAIKLDPREHEAYGNMGVVYLRQQNLPMAAKYFMKSVKLNPMFINSYCNLGNTFVRMGKTKEAIAIYEKALQIMPSCTTAKGELGAIFLAIKELDRAEQLLVQTVAEDPRAAGSHYNLGLLYQVKGEKEKALRSFQAFMTVSDDSGLKEKIAKACELMRRG